MNQQRPRILWPRTRWQDDMAPELAGLEDSAEPWFSPDIDTVTDEQWRECDGIVGYGAYPEDIVRSLKSCRILVVPGVGFNMVDLELWASLGIPVCNTPDYGTREVADHAIALMLTLSKGIAFHDESLRLDAARAWRPTINPFGRRLSSQSFGVLGLGRIGTAAALRARAFDMDVLFYDPYAPNGTEQALGIRRVDSLKELMGQSDFLSIHAPLNDETKNLINAETLAHAKPGMILINTARGAIIDIDALCEAMRADVVLAAGLDVLPTEPPSPDLKLISAWRNEEPWLAHRLVITPHAAFCTPESIIDMRTFSARTAIRYLRDGRLENCVNTHLLKNTR